MNPKNNPYKPLLCQPKKKHYNKKRFINNKYQKNVS